MKKIKILEMFGSKDHLSPTKDTCRSTRGAFEPHTILIKLRQAAIRSGRSRLKASATIEAAVVIPITLVIITAVMTMVFVLHDRVILSTVSQYEAMEQAGESDSSQDIQAAVSEMLQKRLITAHDPVVAASDEEDGLEIDTEGSIEIPMRIVRFLVGEENNQINSQLRISNLSGRKQLIKYKTICDGLSAITRKSEE